MPPNFADEDIDDEYVSPDELIEDIPAQVPASQTGEKAGRIGSEVVDAVESKEQLKDDLYDDVQESSGKKARRIEETRIEETSVNGDEEADEDEYEVEDVVAHKFVKNQVHYRVRWKGYSEDDDTWEPTDNLLPDSRDILAAYHTKIGGEPIPKSKQAGKRKSKANLTDGPDTTTPLPKRQRRGVKDEDSVGDVEAYATPPSDPYGSWLPKAAKWDDLIEDVETVERDDNGNLRAYIKFKNGKKTKVNQNLYYAHCPRALLKFYEKHLSV